MCYCASLLLAFKGDVEAAHAGFAEATKIGDRFGDPQLIALGRVGEGRCLIYLGEIVEGMALLDEAMVAITAHEVSPAAVGDLYCTAIEGCQEVFDAPPGPRARKLFPAARGARWENFAPGPCTSRPSAGPNLQCQRAKERAATPLTERYYCDD